MSRAEKKFTKEIIVYCVQKWRETGNKNYLDEALRLRNSMNER